MFALKSFNLRKPEFAQTPEQPFIAPFTFSDKGHPFDADIRYGEALQRIQQGNWPQAVALLHALSVAYPKTTALEALLDEVRLQADLESTWQDTIKGRTYPRITRRLFRMLLLLALIIGLLSSALVYYQKNAAVSMPAEAAEVLLAQAQQALHNNQSQIAFERFRQLLTTNPQNDAARQGYQEAALQLSLAYKYDLGVAALQAKEYAQALEYFTILQQAALNYRDVARLLVQTQAALEIDRLLANGQAAYQAQQWAATIQAYEALRQIDNTYATEIVIPQLAAAYVQAGQQIVAFAPDQGADLALAEQYFQKALTLNEVDASAQSEATLLTAYLAGEHAQQQGDWAQAVAAWEPIIAQRPQYLNGQLVEQLYKAYLALGDNATQQGQPTSAQDWYNQAARLPVADNHAVADRLHPATATPQPTATPAPVIAVATLPPPLPPTPTPSPTAAGLAAFQGWIAFRSNRAGDAAIYLMQADGSQQQRASNAVSEQMDPLYAQQQGLADGSARAYVATASGRNDANLFVAYAERPDAAPSTVTLTDWGSMEYDPSWSPTGDTIAFVANYTGNDEIWLIPAAGGEARQLTYNEWEWDKHPTWSPDGGQIAFFSNRTGQRQIWVMGADGSGQHNISNNSYEDWDPVWIR